MDTLLRRKLALAGSRRVVAIFVLAVLLVLFLLPFKTP
jgi:hypothetical protein